MQTIRRKPAMSKSPNRALRTVIAAMAPILVCSIMVSCGKKKSRKPRPVRASQEQYYEIPEPKVIRVIGPASATAQPAATPKKSKCPKTMSFIPEPGVCIQKWEAQLFNGNGTLHDPYIIPPMPENMQGMYAKASAGVIPQGYTGRDQAETACSNTNEEGFQFRLCSEEEWTAACQGPKKTLFPYGTSYRIEGKCNTHKFPEEEHLVLRYHPDAKWTKKEMNDSRINKTEGGLAKTGEYRSCTNDFGVFDMVGNLQEWISDTPEGKNGEPMSIAKGDHYMGQGKNYEGCKARDAFHLYYADEPHKNQRDYSRGIRCCADPK